MQQVSNVPCEYKNCFLLYGGFLSPISTHSFANVETVDRHPVNPRDIACIVGFSQLSIAPSLDLTLTHAVIAAEIILAPRFEIKVPRGKENLPLHALSFHLNNVPNGARIQAIHT